MLKNKKALYVLVPLVLAIWGVIGYRIYEGMRDDGPDYFVEQTNIEPVVEML